MRQVVGLAVLVFFISPLPALAVPGVLSYQGRVVLSDQEPLSGSSNVTFALYANETGGVPVWSDTFAVTFDDGYYSVLLGPGTPELSPDLLNDGDRYLGMTLDGANEFLPRHRLASVPYALSAGSVTGPVNATQGVYVGETMVIDDSGQWVGDTSGLQGSSGLWADDEEGGTVTTTSQVGIGTEQPNEALTVDGVISVSEQTDVPTPTSGYGKIYARNMTVSGDENTVLLLPFDSDESVSGRHMELGGAIFSSSGKKFGSSGLYFGGDDLVNYGIDERWNIGTSDFTIDLWIKVDPTQPAWPVLLGLGQNGGQKFEFRLNQAGRLQVWQSFGGTTHTPGDSSTSEMDLRDNNWHHVAAVRDGDTLKLFVDGTLEVSSDVSGMNISGVDMARSGYRLDLSPLNYYKGYIDELRVTEGSIWTEDFSVPSEAYVADEQTLLLAHMDGDRSDSEHTVTVHGDPMLEADESTPILFDAANSVSHYDGSGDFLTIADDPTFDFSQSGDEFTVDFWFYFNSFQGSCDGIVTKIKDGALTSWAVYRNGNHLHLNGYDSGRYYYETSSTISPGQWYHGALVYQFESNTYHYKFFLDGQLDTHETRSLPMSENSLPVTVGAGTEGSNLCGDNSHFDGYIDNVRISKGVARWTEDFTPPESFQGETSGLFYMDPLGNEYEIQLVPR